MLRKAAYVSVWLALLVANLCLLPAQTLSLQFANTPLSEVLKQISKEEGVIIAFQEADVADYRITADLRGMSVSGSLQIVLDGTTLEYEQLNERQFIVSLRVTPPSKTRQLPPPQTRRISGRVLEAQGKSGLPLAVVRIPNSQYGTHTDGNGYFVLMDIPLHLDSLEIRYVGYEKQTIALSTNAYIEIQLQPTQKLLDEVTITEGNDQAVNMADAASVVAINPRKVESLSGLGEPDLLRAIQFLPGISSSDESAGGLHIRGGRPEENLILIDGITVYQPGHLFGTFSAFNPHAVKSLTVQRGGFDARYGGRVSGLVNISARPEQMHEASAEVGLNLLNSNAAIQLPFWKKKAALMISARNSNAGWFNSPFYQNLSARVIDSLRLASQSSGNPRLDADPNFQFWDFNAKMIVRPTDRDLLSLTAYAARDNLDYAWTDSISSAEWFQQTETNLLQNQGASLNWIREWSPRFQQTFNLAYSSFENRFDFRQTYNLFPDPPIGWTQHNRIQDWTLRLDFEWRPDAQTNLSFGYHQTHFSLDSLLDFQGDISEAETFTDQAFLLTPYLQYKRELLPDLTLSLGIRSNYYGATDQYYHEPRISLGYELMPGLNFKAVWGRFNQFLNRTELGSLTGLVEDYWTLADDQRVPVLQSEHWILGGVYQTDNWLLDVELYQKQTAGLITYKDFYREQIFRPVLINGGEGLSRGLDILLQKKFGRYTSWVSYSLSQTTYRFPELLQGESFAASHDQRHQLSWVNVLEIGQWDASLNWTFASGRPYTEATQLLASRPEGSTQTIYSLGFAPINSSRLPAYHRLDASLTYRYQLFAGRLGGKAGLSVFNLYNRQNIQNIDYRLRLPLSKADEPSIFRFDKNLLGFTPNLFLQFEF